MHSTSRNALATMAILTLIGAGMALGLLGCGSDDSRNDLVDPTADVVLFPGGADADKLDASDEKIVVNRAGINLGYSGYFHSLVIPVGYVDNHWFTTKANVAYQVEVIAEGADTDVDLYIGRSSHPFSHGDWKSSARSYPLMDGIVFKAAQDGVMFVDVYGASDGITKGISAIDYHIHVRKCQFGAFTN